METSIKRFLTPVHSAREEELDCFSERYPSYGTYDNRESIECNYDEGGYGKGEEIINNNYYPWFPYTHGNVFYSHTVINHETSGYLFCNGYGAGKAVAKVEPESCDTRMIPAIIDVNVSGGTNEGINKFNGEQLHHVGIVVEKGDYYVTEKSISVLFDHVRGDIAIVRAVNLDFSISKGYLVKCLDNERQTRYFFGKTLRQAMKSRMAFLNP